MPNVAVAAGPRKVQKGIDLGSLGEDSSRIMQWPVLDPPKREEEKGGIGMLLGRSGTGRNVKRR